MSKADKLRKALSRWGDGEWERGVAVTICDELGITREVVDLLADGCWERDRHIAMGGVVALMALLEVAGR